MYETVPGVIIIQSINCREKDTYPEGGVFKAQHYGCHTCVACGLFVPAYAAK